MKKLISCMFGLLLSAFTAQAEVKLPRLLSNGMVLQRNQSIKIWGWANVGEAITLTFKDKTYHTQADSKQQWSITIEPQKAGGPFKIRINTIEINDVLIGEVWLCAGQSNMEAQLSRPNIKAAYMEMVAQSHNSLIRQFAVKTDMAFSPQANVTSDKAWVAANPTTVLSFSAVAYFFAKELYQKYKVPIGIINSSVGGTPIQSWVASESLKPWPAYHQAAIQLQDTAEVSRLLKAHQLQTESWYTSIKEDDLGIKEQWQRANEEQESTWPTLANLTQLNEKINLPKYGSMWFKTTVNVPDHLAGKPATLYLGNMLTQDETYLNGQKVGTINSSYTERNYTIAPGLLKPGKNLITIRLISPTTGISFNTKKSYQLQFDRDSILLTAPWKFKFGVEKAILPRGNGLSLHSPTAYYYAMIKPLSNYSIKGIAWYQGESNVSKPDEYEGLLNALIKQWREDWRQPHLPFLYVQLANFSSTGIEPTNSNWALLRAAQLRVLKTSNTAMVVAHDIGERNELHPYNKLDVGKRLALAAQKTAYHENIIASGPIYRSISIAGSKVFVSFSEVGRGLKFTGQSLVGFSLSADGKNFIPANAEIRGKQVVVWAASLKSPIAVRYAWADSPDGANLYNLNGLPASSFHSKDHL